MTDVANDNANGPSVQHTPVSRRQFLATAGATGVASGFIVAGKADVALASGCGDACHNVKDYGAIGDGATDDSAAIQAAIDALPAAGGVVFAPAGVYIISTGLVMRNGLTLTGAGRAATILRLATTSNDAVLKSDGSSGIFQSVDDLTLTDLTLDGDAPNTQIASTVPTSALLHAYQSRRWHLARCRFVGGRGYGIGLQGSPTSPTPGKQGPHEDTYIGNCEFISNGKSFLADTADGIDVKSSERFTMVDCYAYDNADAGINIRGRFVELFGCTSEANTGGGINLGASASPTDVDDTDAYFTLVGCAAESNGDSGFAVLTTISRPTHASIIGCHARKNAAGLTAIAPQSSGRVRLAVAGGEFVDNAIRGIGINDCQQLTITAALVRDNDNDGIRLANQGSGAAITGCDVRSNGGYGICSSGTSNGVVIDGSVVTGNGAGQIELVGNLNRAASNNTDASAPVNVVSAASITLASHADLFNVTGTTTIASITPSYPGRMVVLRFASHATLTDGSNLTLSGDLVATADDTIALSCDGVNWYETARSVN